jgi:hypothetical protein
MAICLRVEGPLRVRDALQFLASAVDDPKTVVREESRRTAARSYGGVTGLLSYVSDELQTLLSQAEHHPARLVWCEHVQAPPWRRIAVRYHVRQVRHPRHLSRLETILRGTGTVN